MHYLASRVHTYQCGDLFMQCAHVRKPPVPPGGQSTPADPLSFEGDTPSQPSPNAVKSARSRPPECPEVELQAGRAVQDPLTVSGGPSLFRKRPLFHGMWNKPWTRNRPARGVAELEQSLPGCRPTDGTIVPGFNTQVRSSRVLTQMFRRGSRALYRFRETSTSPRSDSRVLFSKRERGR